MNSIGSLDHLPNELVSEVLNVFTYNHQGTFNHFSYISSTLPCFQRFLRLDTPLIILTNNIKSLKEDQNIQIQIGLNREKTLIVDLKEDIEPYSVDEHLQNETTFLFVIYEDDGKSEEEEEEGGGIKSRDSDTITPKPHWEKSMNFIINELHYFNLKYEAVLVGKEFGYNQDTISKNLCSKRRRRLCDGIRYIKEDQDMVVLCDQWGKYRELIQH